MMEQKPTNPVINNRDLDRLRQEYSARSIRLANSDRYSLFNTSNLFVYQQRQREVLALLKRYHMFPLNERQILELGCGGGGVLLEFLTFGADPRKLRGIDLLPERVKTAHLRLPGVSLSCGDAQSLPYASDQFDLIIQFTVFTSILDNEVKANIAKEMVRVVKPDGLILWYDFWFNPINKQTRGIRPAEIRILFPGCQVEFRRITLAPPIARRLVPVSWMLAYLTERLGIFNTHYLAAIRPEKQHH